MISWGILGIDPDLLRFQKRKHEVIGDYMGNRVAVSYIIDLHQLGVLVIHGLDQNPAGWIRHTDLGRE